MTADHGAAPAGGASFYALVPEFEWLASAWDGFARELADTGAMLRHVAEAATADPAVAAESSGLFALESATDRLVQELVDVAARIRRTLATYEQADAAVHASVPGAQLPTPPMPLPAPVFVPGTHSAPTGDPIGPGTGIGPGTEIGSGAGGYAGGDTQAPDAAQFGVPHQGQGTHLWHPGPDAAPQATSTALGTLSRFRRDMLARADHWVAQQVPYSQEAWHEGYRTDCSGFISMCWGLRDSMVTSTLPQVSHRIAKEDLRPGDILNNTDVATGHVIMFDRWADYAHSSYVGYELCPQGTLHHVIPYPYYAGFGEYEPYRYDQAGD